MRYILICLFCIGTIFVMNAQKNNSLQIQAGYGLHSYSMGQFNSHYIEGSGKKYWGFKKGIQNGHKFNCNISYNPFGLFDIGVSGNYQFGETIGNPEFIEYNDFGNYVKTHDGTFKFKAESIGVGIANNWYADPILFHKESRLNNLHIAVEIYGGISFSRLISDLRYPTLQPTSSNYQFYTSNQDFQGQIALKLEYDYVKSPVIGSIGIKGGYQYFKTRTVRDRLGKEWIVTGNHPINLDFSGFFGTVFLTVGK